LGGDREYIPALRLAEAEAADEMVDGTAAAAASSTADDVTGCMNAKLELIIF
jgi:hypothetical protein